VTCRFERERVVDIIPTEAEIICHLSQTDSGFNLFQHDLGSDA